MNFNKLTGKDLSPQDEPFKHEIEMDRQRHFRNRHHIANRTPNAVGNSINTATPKSWTLKHIRTRYKTLQLKEDREAVVHQDNTILLKAMARTITTPGFSSKPFHEGPVGAITAAGRRRYLTAVTRDNRFYLEHLIRTPPVYSMKEWQTKAAKDSWNLDRMRKFHYEPRSTALDELANEGHKEIKAMIAQRQRVIKGRAEQERKEAAALAAMQRSDEAGEMPAVLSPSRSAMRPPTSAAGSKSTSDLQDSLTDATPTSSHVARGRFDGPLLSSAVMSDMDAVPMPGTSIGARPQTTTSSAVVSPSSVAYRSPTHRSTKDIKSKAVLHRQVQWMVVVPDMEAPTRGFSGRVQRLWGEISVSAANEDYLIVNMQTPSGARQPVDVKLIVDPDTICSFSNRMDFPTKKSEVVELAVLLSQNVHVRGDSPDTYEVRLDHDTASLSEYAAQNAEKAEWMNEAPTRVFRTASVMQQGTDAAATHAALMAKMAEMAEQGGIQEDDGSSHTSTSASQSEQTTNTVIDDDEESIEASKNAIVAEYRKIPMYITSPELGDKYSGEVFMNVIAKISLEGEDFGAAVVLARAVQAVPDVERSDQQHRLTVRLPTFATVDDDAAAQFINRVVDSLKVYVDEKKQMSVKATSNRAASREGGPRKPAAERR